MIKPDAAERAAGSISVHSLPCFTSSTSPAISGPSITVISVGSAQMTKRAASAGSAKRTKATVV